MTRSLTHAILIPIAAVCSLALQLKYIPIVGMGPGFEAVSIARSLATQGTFADPFDAHTGPTAHLAPLYPALLAGVRRLTVNEEYFRVATLCLTLLAHLLNIWLLYRVAGELFDRVTRILTLAIALVVPLYQVIPAWESIYLSCGALGFWLLARRRKMVAAGLFGGLLLLLNPAMAAITLPVAFCEWKQMKMLGLFVGVMFLVVTPWEIRNYATFHKLFFIRDNLGLELDVYNNDCEAFHTTDCFPHPLRSAAEQQAIRTMGEAAYNDMRMRRAIAWFGSHPAAALRLVGRRIVEFWFPIRTHPPLGWCISAVTIASLWGFWCMWRDRMPALRPMLAISALYPIVYYLVRFDLRYRYPILWIPVFCAAYGIAHARGGPASVQKLHHNAHAYR